MPKLFPNGSIALAQICLSKQIREAEAERGSLRTEDLLLEDSGLRTPPLICLECCLYARLCFGVGIQAHTKQSSARMELGSSGRGTVHMIGRQVEGGVVGWF